MVLGQVIAVEAGPVVGLDQLEPVLEMLAERQPAVVEVIENPKAHHRLLVRAIVAVATPGCKTDRSGVLERARSFNLSAIQLCPMSDDPTAPRPPPIGMLALLLLGCLLYAATIGSISDLGSTDAAGRGLGEAFGVIYGFGLWTVLAAMVVIGGVNGKMPAWGGIAASILVPASAVVPHRLAAPRAGADPAADCGLCVLGAPAATPPGLTARPDRYRPVGRGAGPDVGADAGLCRAEDRRRAAASGGEGRKRSEGDGGGSAAAR